MRLSFAFGDRPRMSRVRSVVAAAVAGVAAVTLPGGAGVDARSGPRLEVVADRVIYSSAVAAGDRFRLTHVHSVTRRPVTEIFSAQASGAVAIEEMWFDEFGPNLPAGAEQVNGVKTTFTHVGDKYRVIHHGRPIGTIRLIVGRPSVDHAVILPDGDRIRLLDLVKPGTPIVIRVRPDASD